MLKIPCAALALLAFCCPNIVVEVCDFGKSDDYGDTKWQSRKHFELLDCPKFAFPNLTDIDVVATAANILERLQGKGFLNYGQIWSRMGDIADGLVNDDYLAHHLNGYSVEWKNENLQAVARLLAGQFGGKGRWYKVGQVPIEVLPGAYFKPSIRGTWYFEKQAYSVCIMLVSISACFPSTQDFLG